jgi:8-oxo-dGTP pyrophosphatase MutT (NUDIX family)
MIQRKDSICFVEFIRGKYALMQKEYLLTLFRGMTPLERALIQKSTFEELWAKVWKNHHKSFTEHMHARDKFNTLKSGTIVTDHYVFDIDYILKNTTPTLLEPEWEFPKGRKNSSESHCECALREFEEESGISRNKLRLMPQFQAMNLFKMGCNGTMYRGIYFVGKCVERVDQISLVNLNDMQSREVMCVRWVDYNGVLSRLHNEEQVKAFDRMNKRIIDSITSSS